jgi:hypothetical protein
LARAADVPEGTVRIRVVRQGVASTSSYTSPRRRIEGGPTSPLRRVPAASSTEDPLPPGVEFKMPFPSPDEPGMGLPPEPDLPPVPMAPVRLGAIDPVTLKVRVLECLNPKKDLRLPAGVKVGPTLEKHTACGSLKARVLLDDQLIIDPARPTVHEHLQTVPYVRTVVDLNPATADLATRKAGGTLKVGIVLTATLRGRTPDAAEMEFALTSLDAELAEEMVYLSDGQVFTNPRPHVKERGFVSHATLPFGKTDILSGEAYVIDTAPEKIPPVFPEEGRLWLEVTAVN